MTLFVKPRYQKKQFSPVWRAKSPSQLLLINYNKHVLKNKFKVEKQLLKNITNKVEKNVSL